MKHLRQFEDFNFKDLFKSKEQKNREKMFGTKDLSRDKRIESQIMIDCEPYDISQFGQKKYGVYIENSNKHYYIGDIREFSKTKDNSNKYSTYMSYLNIEKIVEKEPTGTLCHPNSEVMDIINKELDKNYLSSNLMDDTITFREFLKERGIL